jgi:hypothetical protein
LMEALVQRFPGARLGVNAVTALVIWGLLTWVNQFIEPLMSYYLATAAMYATAMFAQEYFDKNLNFRIQAYHFLWELFPEHSTKIDFCNLSFLMKQENKISYNPLVSTSSYLQN